MRSLRAFLKKGCRKVARAKAQNKHKQAKSPKYLRKTPVQHERFDVWYPAATYFPARGSHSAARSFSVAGAPRTPCLTGSPVRFIVHRTRSQSIPSPALVCLTWPGKYLLIKDQRKTPCAAWCFSLVSGGYLFSRAVTSQVSSAYKGLTSVFGMRTGGSP